jgi:hypothetical protein
MQVGGRGNDPSHDHDHNRDYDRDRDRNKRGPRIEIVNGKEVSMGNYRGPAEDFKQGYSKKQKRGETE